MNILNLNLEVFRDMTGRQKILNCNLLLILSGMRVSYATVVPKRFNFVTFRSIY